MKRNLNRAALCLMATLVASSLWGATVREEFDKTYRLAPGGEFVLENMNGSITIETWDRPEVRVEAEKVVNSGSRSRAEDAMEKLEIQVTHTSSSLRVVTAHPRNSSGALSWLFGSGVDFSVRYHVTVPKEVDLDVSTTNGGIEARGVSGSHHLASTNGKIRLFESSGDLNATTTNGSIEAELLELGSSAMRLTTTNGRITVRLPPDLRADLNASTTNGSIETDFPVTTNSFRKTSLRGSINGGGPELRLATTNGSIRIYEIN